MELLQEMIDCGVNAIIIKTASLGLDPDVHLGQSISEMQTHLLESVRSFMYIFTNSMYNAYTYAYHMLTHMSQKIILPFRRESMELMFVVKVANMKLSHWTALCSSKKLCCKNIYLILSVLISVGKN